MAVFVFKKMTSTNAEAKNPCYAHGDVVVALEQTAGRGQRGNKWDSAAGQNLTLSLIWKPDFLPAKEQFLLSEAVALALVDTLAQYKVEATIKWTNDIYVGDDKVCGVLIEHDLGAEGIVSTPEVVASIKRRMDELIAANLPIVRHKMLHDEAIETYRNLGFEDKIEILSSRPHLYVTVYKIDDMAGYFYGALAPSTGYLHLYDLAVYYNGIYIAIPQRTAPDKLEPMIAQDKMFDVFQQFKDWVL